MKNFVGRHLILDVQTNSKKGIDEIITIYSILENLSKQLDMTLVYPPIVARFPWGNCELTKFIKELKEESVQSKIIKMMEGIIERRATSDAGVSGITVWLESHAALHTWVNKNFFSFDAYSCKDFDAQKAIDLILSYFDVKKYSGLDIIRTLNKPQKIKKLKANREIHKKTTDF